MDRLRFSLSRHRAAEALISAGAALLLTLPACGGSSSNNNIDAPLGGPDAAVDGPPAVTPDGMPDAGNMTLAPKAVYTMSNATGGNDILVYTRDTGTGALASAGQYSTGGKGSGKGLGSQGALVWDPSQNRFFAVNAGDHTISMMALQDDGSLNLESNVDSGGVDPISITVHGDVVYVVNAGDSTTSPATPGSISGFKIASGALTPIDNSTLPLSVDNPGPRQIQFVDGGKYLVVTEKGTDKIDLYTVDPSGLAAGPIIHPSAGSGPFGFATDAAGHLVVSDAADGAASSYAIGTVKSGLSPISATVASQQSAPCWVVLGNGYAYITNTKSGSISGYTLASDGTMTYKWSVNSSTAGTPKPIDAGLSSDGKYLYVLNSGEHAFGVFGVNSSNGTLSSAQDFTGLPTNAAGVAVGSNAVYTMSNTTAASASLGNTIKVYTRAADGTLSTPGTGATVSTGGNGTGAGLGSQNSLVLDSTDGFLFAVNAGANSLTNADGSISMLPVNSDGSLGTAVNVDSGGVKPVSVTVHGNFVYVVNAGDGTATNPANITGFQISGAGANATLSAIASSTMPLSADAVGPAQIQFSNDGKLLFVTEKKTNRIDTYTVAASGVPSGPNTYPSVGTTPFGFAETQNGQLVVTNAFGGMASKGAASSYAIDTTGSLGVISAAITSGQKASCWVSISGNMAYVTNAKTNNLSAYQIASDGTLTHQFDADTGAKPLDEGVSDDGQFLYVLNAGDGTFSIYTINSDGSLTQKSPLSGLPATAVALIAR